MLTEPLPPGLRRLPQQARSRQRVDAIVTALVDLVREGNDAGLTTAEVADRAGIPLGSLYEYFEDRDAIVDVAVDRMLAHHGSLLGEIAAELPPTLVGVAERVYDGQVDLYRRHPGCRALRFSTLFRPVHREWYQARIDGFAGQVARAGTRLGANGSRKELTRGLQLVFAVTDATLRHAFVQSSRGDRRLLDDGREVVRFAAGRLSGKPVSRAAAPRARR